jgi:hypothetical protein
MTRDYQIAAYYFPNYHPDARNALVHGNGWTEWELVQRAEARFAGHRQPRFPQWGYEDESNPAVMAKKIAAAAEHGVDAFLFDWYFYDDGPFLERGLERGFLHAPNNDRIQFALMWANHDWLDIHPATRRACQQNEHKLLYLGKVTPQTFERVVAYVIETYFKHPAYWKIDGAPYFSFYDLSMLVANFGNNLETTRQALAEFRARTLAAGFPGLHLNQVLWNTGVLSGEAAIRQPAELLAHLGFNSFTSYVWVHHASLETFPETEYWPFFDKYLNYWQHAQAEIPLPYYPNATVGWDASPRTVQSDIFANVGYPFTPALKDNTPERFKQALQIIKQRMDARGDKILTINSWNEWTEGSYLEPDTVFGMRYLEAIRDVFGTSSR